MTSEKRKQKSKKRLSKLGVDILESLPIIESENDAKLRSPKDVARRVMALVSVAAVSDGVDKTAIINFIKNENLWTSLSPEEVKFIEAKKNSKQSKIQLGWRSESIWLLLWSLKLVDKLELPIKQCCIDDILDRVPRIDDSTEHFISSAKLRSISDILDESDFIYRAHWATRDRDLNEGTKYGKLDPDVIMERHKAINWLTCYDDAEWDEVTTDT